MKTTYGKLLPDKKSYEYTSLHSEDFQFICNNASLELRDHNYSSIEPGFISKSLVNNHFHHKINSLHFLIEGTAEMTFNGKKIQLASGDVFLISNQVKCTWEYLTPAREITLLFNYYMGTLDDLPSNITEPMIIHNCFSDVTKAQRLFENNDPLSLFELKNISVSYISKFLSLSNADLHNHIMLAKKYADIFLYIHEHLAIDLHLEDIAAATNRSLGFFSKKFRREVGYSAKQYINDKVMAEVEQLLIYSNLPIGEISARFRFCEQSYFTRWFKRQKGCTPSEYRNLWESHAYKLTHGDFYNK